MQPLVKNSLQQAVTLVIVYLSTCSASLLEGIYCGRDNCYDVLNVTRESTTIEISRAYRQMAKVHHPDRHRTKEAKIDAEEKFKLIATAYGILKDDDARTDYNYMLDNPSEYYAHYYRYYRRRMTPKVDVRLVLFFTITIISIVHYYVIWERYDSAIKYFMTVQKYRIKALEIAEEQKIVNNAANGAANGKVAKAKTKNKLSKAEQKEEQDRIIRKIIEENMDIKGAFAKPQLTDVLWVQLIFLPYILAKYIYWQLRWIWRFTLLRQAYGDEEKLYIIRRYLKMGQYQFDGIDDDEKQEYLELELWDKENFDEWKEDKDEAMKAQKAESARHKSYRRYMKNHGPGRMTFED